MEDTVAYMLLGYVAATLIMLGLIGYLVLKARHLRAETALLKALEAEQAAENAMDSKAAAARQPE